MKVLTPLSPSRVRSRRIAVLLVGVGLTFAARGKFLEAATASVAKPPVALQTDSLTNPLGIDDDRPRFSWKLQDTRQGAKQTAYQIGVYSSAGVTGVGDVWDSGRVESGASIGVAYAGPVLQPEKRYFWRVKVWDFAGKPYPLSETAWWETGLMDQTNWHADWIGYENDELHSVRESGAQWITNVPGSPGQPRDVHYDFRYFFSLDKPVKQASLYTTGEDTVASWVNGKPVLQAKPLPPWKGSPWGTYECVDVTPVIQNGRNLLAIGVLRYRIGNSPNVPLQSPMSAVLVVTFQDGSLKTFKSQVEGWEAAVDAPDGWWQPGNSVGGNWQKAVIFAPKSDGLGGVETTLPWPTGPVAALRKPFDTTGKKIVSGRLYATSLGAYKLYLNGSPVGDQIMSPGWMDYREHVPYQVYDVTSQLKSGRNALGAYLAAGWYSTPLAWFRQSNNYGATQPALKAQLRLEYADGSVQWVATDSSWKADTSPILFAEIYDGETRDARREQAGWDSANFADESWHAASTVPAKEPKIIAQFFQPIREERVMTVKTITEPKPGIYIYDFGQNMSALPKLHVRGSAGQTVQLRFGEILNSDGTLYTDNLRTAKATDRFTLSGKGPGGFEDFEPMFTFHGFRYAEITGVNAKPTAETLKAAVIHTDAPFTAKLTTGDPMVNQVWSNVIWGQRSNFVGLPTDCPQRDERLGWSADAQVFWRTAAFNMNLAAFTRKFTADLRGTQVGTAMYGIYAPGLSTPNAGFGAAWSDAGVIIPWSGWVQSGDTRIIDDNWNGMTAYLSEIAGKNPDHLWRNGFGIPYGDWLTPTITTPEDLLATAYWAYDVTLMQQMAAATGRTGDERKYAEQFEAIKAAFQKAYVGKDGFVGTVDRHPSIPPPTVKDRDAAREANTPVETQTGYVLAIYMHLLPDHLRAAAANRLIDLLRQNNWLLGTGFVGTPYLLAALTDTGHSDIAYRLLLNHEYPSWGYLVDHGATTTWERWNGDKMRDDPAMNSYNHYAYGAVAEWLYRYGAGIDTDATAAGFHRIYLHPHFDSRLGSMILDYDSPYGPVHSGWTVAKNGSVKWDLVVPPNTTAALNTANTNGQAYTIDGKPLDSSRGVTRGAAASEYILPSGHYSFTAVIKPGTTEISDAR